jgi:hypothetical protein
VRDLLYELEDCLYYGWDVQAEDLVSDLRNKIDLVGSALAALCRLPSKRVSADDPLGEVARRQWWEK